MLEMAIGLFNIDKLKFLKWEAPRKIVPCHTSFNHEMACVYNGNNILSKMPARSTCAHPTSTSSMIMTANMNLAKVLRRGMKLFVENDDISPRDNCTE